MESTEKARVALIAPLAILTPLSFSSNFPRAQYLDIRSLTHELIVKGWVDLLSYGDFFIRKMDRIKGINIHAALRRFRKI